MWYQPQNITSDKGYDRRPNQKPDQEGGHKGDENIISKSPNTGVPCRTTKKKTWVDVRLQLPDGLLSVTAIAPDQVQTVAKEKAQTPMMSGKHHVKRSRAQTKALSVTWASDGQAART